jgi:twitching motility protein PilT
MTMNDIIMEARARKCSDIHISEGMRTIFRIHGQMVDSGIEASSDEIKFLIMSMLDEEQEEVFKNGDDVDFAIQTPDGCRQRVNVFMQQKRVAATIRLLNNTIPQLEALNMPPVLKSLADQPRGLILVTGPTGSGKSTTLAAMIDYINQKRAEHIITIEDPIEYVYTSGMSLIHQREIGVDSKSFAASLRSALRQDPDIILVGEMRDYETISAAVTAAETGHLVMSTLHTTGAAQTLDRIIDSCPPHSQNQIRTQLSTVLKGVITQALVPLAAGEGRVAATEILIGTDAVGSLIRENKCYQLGTSMQSGASYGMHTLNNDLARLVRQGTITKADAMRVSTDKNELKDLI